jgi:hypothetical protein
MAKKTDLAADKARKQKMILIVGGVLLLAVAAIQGPKLLKHGGSPAAAPEAAAATDASGGTASTATNAVGAVSIAPTHSFAAAAYVAGVALPGASTGTVTAGQLATFTLFADKDPFVQQVGDGTGAVQDAGTAAGTPTGTPAPGAPSVSGATTPAAVKPEPIVFATIMLDGKPQQVQLDGKKVDKEFPKESPLFVLAGLKKNQAKIGVAGGSFDNGQTVTLKLGKKVTLVDTATGVEYELKLTYTGSSAQVLESFSSAPPQPAAADGASATPTATPVPASP